MTQLFREKITQPFTFIILWVIGIPIFVALSTGLLLIAPVNDWAAQGFLVASVIAYTFTSPFSLVYFSIWGIMRGIKQRKSEDTAKLGSLNLYISIGGLILVALMVVLDGVHVQIPQIAVDAAPTFLPTTSP